MNRILILLILVSNLGITITAQESSRNECPIKELNEHTEKRINNYLNEQSGFINLFVPYYYIFLRDSLFKATLCIDTINSEIFKVIHQSVDSIIIVLDNGLSWNLNKEPPAKPKWFYFRLFSKKARESQEFVDRFRFLEFSTQLGSLNKSPCGLHIFKVYTEIVFEGKPVFNAVYEFDPKKKSKRVAMLELYKIENN